MLVGFLILAAFFGLFRLGTQSMWMDEVASAEIGKLTMGEIWKLNWNEEANMWLYYSLMHYWEKFSQTDAWVRGLSVLLGVVALIPVYKLARAVFDKRVADIAVFLAAINFFFIFNLQNARSYSLLMLLTAWASWEFYKLISGKSKNWWVFGLLTAAAMYTHFYAALIILGQIVISLCYPEGKKKLKDLVKAGVLTGVLLVPLAMAPSIRGDQFDWVPKPTVTSLFGTLIVLSGDSVITTGVMGMLLVFGLGQMIKKKQLNWDKMYIAASLAVPIVFAFFFSIIIKPMYQSVYFLICLPPFLMLVAYGLRQFKKRWQLVSVLGVITVASLVRLAGWYGQDPSMALVIDNKKEEWKQATDYIRGESASGDAIIFYGYFTHFSYDHYMGRVSWPEEVEIASQKYPIGGGGKLPEPDTARINNLGSRYSRVWLVLSHENDAAGRDMQGKRVQEELELNYDVAKTREFEKVKVILYE